MRPGRRNGEEQKREKKKLICDTLERHTPEYSKSGFAIPLKFTPDLGLGPTAIVAPDALLGAVGLSRLGVETNGRFHLFTFIHAMSEKKKSKLRFSSAVLIPKKPE